MRSERGFSLLEITIVLAIVSAIMILTYRMIEESMRTTMFSESHNDLSVMSQAAVNRVHTEVLQARMVFEEDSLGIAYRAAFAMPSEYPIWTTSLLPVIDATTTVISPDASGTRFTGNSLLIARQLPPLTIDYDDDDDFTTPDIQFVADRYRFEYFYLSPTSEKSFEKAGRTLDLRLASSIDYADYFQLSTLTSGTGEIVEKLIDAGLERAWDPGQPIDSAFYVLDDATDGSFNSALNAPTIEMTGNRTLLRGLLGGRISGAMEYSVAFGSYRLPQPQTVFGRNSGGFEVKIVGPAGNRQVLTRILLMAHIRGTFESQQGFVTTAARF
jgi:prepilin-type N-terminal cleavage/methylation domain-containing protein